LTLKRHIYGAMTLRKTTHEIATLMTTLRVITLMITTLRIKTLRIIDITEIFNISINDTAQNLTLTDSPVGLVCFDEHLLINHYIYDYNLGSWI
jgi:hypothetical protein